MNPKALWKSLILLVDTETKKSRYKQKKWSHVDQEEQRVQRKHKQQMRLSVPVFGVMSPIRTQKHRNEDEYGLADRDVDGNSLVLSSIKLCFSRFNDL